MCPIYPDICCDVRTYELSDLTVPRVASKLRPFPISLQKLMPHTRIGGNREII
jgi:hypothetical protein